MILSRLSYFALALALPATLSATLPAAAQALTAQDVLDVQNNLISRLGFTPMGRLEDGPQGLQMVDTGGRMVLPFDWGEIGWHLSPFTLQEADEAVLVTWEEDLLITLNYRPRPQGQKPGMGDPDITTRFAITAQDYTSRVTGSAADMVITSQAALYEARLVDAAWSMPPLAAPPSGGKPAAARPQIALSLQDWVGQMRLTGFTEDNDGTATLASTDSAALMATNYAFSDMGVTTSGASAQEDATSSLSLSLPATPMVQSGLGASLRAGFALHSTTSTGATHSDSTTQGNGLDGMVGADADSHYRQTTATSAANISLDAAGGLRIAADSDSLFFSLRDMWISDTPIETTIAQAGFALALPVMANGQREQASLTLDLTELRTDASPFFGRDMSEAFTHEPFTFGLTLGADYEPLVDLTDMGGFIDVLESDGLVRAYDFGIDRLDLRYGEASLTGGGRLSWGWRGAVLGENFPNPKGSLTFTLSGAYALLTRLGQENLLPPAMLSAARGAVAAFGQAKGPDVVESTITLGPDGFTINGVPAPF